MDHLDVVVMQPDFEHAVIRDLLFGVLAFNTGRRGPILQVSFPHYADRKMIARGTVGPLVRVTGPSEPLQVLTLRHEVSAHLRAGRALSLRQDRAPRPKGSHERFRLLTDRRSVIGPEQARPLVLYGQPRLLDAAGRSGAVVHDEALYVARDALDAAAGGVIDPLGFSSTRTVPVLA